MVICLEQGAETFVIIALYKSTLTIPYHTIPLRTRTQTTAIYIPFQFELYRCLTVIGPTNVFGRWPMYCRPGCISSRLMALQRVATHATTMAVSRWGGAVGHRPSKSWLKKVKFSHTRYRALGPELIPVYRQSAQDRESCRPETDILPLCHATNLKSWLGPQI